MRPTVVPGWCCVEQSAAARVNEVARLAIIRRAPAFMRANRSGRFHARAGRRSRIEWLVVLAVHSIGADLTLANGREPGEVDSRADLHQDGRRRYHGPPRRRAGLEGRSPRRCLRDRRRAERRAGLGPGPRTRRRGGCDGRLPAGRAVRPGLGSGGPVSGGSVSSGDHGGTRRKAGADDRPSRGATPPLAHFILPGGCPPAAQMHLARAVCRPRRAAGRQAGSPTRPGPGRAAGRRHLP